MKILYYDCFSGISGDMNLGALVDIGVDKNYLENELLKLNIHGYELKLKRDVKNGISGAKVDVVIEHHNHHSNMMKCEHSHHDTHKHTHEMNGEHQQKILRI